MSKPLIFNVYFQVGVSTPLMWLYTLFIMVSIQVNSIQFLLPPLTEDIELI